MTEAAREARPTPKPANDPSLTDRARDRAASALTATRDAARDVGRRAGDGVEAAPLAVLAGGIAVGAIAGLLLPRTEQEDRYLGPVGRKLSEGASAAAVAAREAGKAELAAAGLSQVGASEQFTKLLENVGKAVSSAGAAARETRKRKA